MEVAVKKDKKRNRTAVDEIKDSIYTRKTAKGVGICAVQVSTGGMTKGFKTLDELAQYIYSTYGDRWSRCVRRKDTDTGGISHTDKTNKVMIAADLEGDFPMLDKDINYGGVAYKIFDAPRDGSCMYHVIEALLRPHLDNPPSPIALRAQLIEFYSGTGEIQQKFQELLGVNFEERRRDVMSPDNWGQYDDLIILASIYRVSFYLFIVESLNDIRVLNAQEIIGLRRDGVRLSRPAQLSRVLIFFRRNQHYGVGVRSS